MFPATWDKARLIDEIDGAWNSPNGDPMEIEDAIRGYG